MSIRTMASVKSAMILVVSLVLIGICCRPCTASDSIYDRQIWIDRLRQFFDSGFQSEDTSLEASKILSFWNGSWPQTVKNSLEEESLGSVEEGLQSHNVSTQCVDDLSSFLYGLAVRDTWALKMLDASGKVASGIFNGNNQWLGSYSECIVISSDKSQLSRIINVTVRAEYCLVNIGYGPESISTGQLIHLGICIPKTCNTLDVLELINTVLYFFSPEVSAVNANCFDNSTPAIDNAAIVVIVILCILGVFLLLGTCYNIISNYRKQRQSNTANDEDDDPLLDADPGPEHHPEVTVQNIGADGTSSEVLRVYPITQSTPRHSESCVVKVLMAFSISANVKKIFNVEKQQTDGKLQAIHGMRFISMTWVILGHTYLLCLGSTSNVVVYLQLIKRFSFQAILNATVSVDTFFVLSGTLVSFLLLKEIREVEGVRKIQWAKFFFHRFWRLTPLYMLILAIYAALFKYFGNGPYWNTTSDEICRQNWWTNLLYVNNIVRSDQQCIGWSWYLANDMQFFLLSPIFIVLLYVWPLIGGVLVFVFMLVSNITTGVLTYVNHYPPSTPGLLQNTTLEQLAFNHVYIVPWCRISPYLIGILLGFTLYKTNCKLKLPVGLVAMLWALAAACNLSVLYGLFNVSRGYYLTPQMNAFYASVHRTAWAIGVSWVILACATENGGFINKMLSWSAFVPLSRLTYAAYLTHPLVMIWYIYNLKVPIHVDDISMIYLFIGHVVVTYAISLVMSVAFEAPMINLERSFLRKSAKRD